MVRHMVMWKLKPEAAEPPEVFERNLAAMRLRFGQMQRELPYIKNLQLHPSYKRGDGFYDFVVIQDFETREDLERYQVSPTHRDPEAAAFCAKIRQEKAVVDFEY